MRRPALPCSSIPILIATLQLLSCGGAAPAAQAAPPAPAEASDASEPAAAAPEPEPAPVEPAATEADTTEPSAEPASTASDDKSLSNGETRTMSVIQKVVLDNRSVFRACYDSVQAKVPELKGDMTLYFVLSANGRVKEASLNEARSTIKNDELTQCAIGELRKLQFPASSKGLETKVNYPFNFNPH